MKDFFFPGFKMLFFTKTNIFKSKKKSCFKKLAGFKNPCFAGDGGSYLISARKPKYARFSKKQSFLLNKIFDRNLTKILKLAPLR